LIEVMIAITLLGVLMLAMLFAMRIGLSAFGKVGAKLMDNRRVAGAQRVLQQEIEGMMPVVAPCLANAATASQGIAFFQGDPRTMRLVSTFSLQQAWRGQPQILEFAVIPGADERGVRLIVNEIPYTGSAGAGGLCLGFGPDPATGVIMPRFAPIEAGPQSFVLADRLEFCRLSYLSPAAQPGLPPIWKTDWSFNGWPLGVRVEMAPLVPDGTRLEPITVTAALHLHRSLGIPYDDF
jgi:hypothetical protein